MFVFESTRIKNGGPPLHYHYTQDEWFYILKGDFLFKIGDVTFTLKEINKSRFELTIESSWQASENYKKNTSVDDF